MRLDKVDKKILNLLQRNARMTIKDIASELGLSTTPIFERIKRLEKNEVIDRYVALLNRDKLDFKITAFVEVVLNDHALASVDQFVENIEKMDEVMEIYHITGEYDFILKVVVKDMDAYSEFITKKVHFVPQIGRVNSKFALAQRKFSTAVNVK